MINEINRQVDHNLGMKCQFCGETGYIEMDYSQTSTPNLVGRSPCMKCPNGVKVRLLPPFPIMIDSGAYSAWTLGIDIDIDAYIAFIHEFRKDYPQAVFITLDVIENEKKSYENWKIMNRAGVTTLPVFHPTPHFEWKYLYRYIDETSHIAIGGSSAAPRVLRRIAFDQTWSRLVDSNGLPRVKVHGLGVSGFSDLRGYPWYSVDSSTWMRPATFGNAMIPRRRHGKWDYYSDPLKVHVDRQDGFEVARSGKLSLGTISKPERESLLRYIRELEIPVGFYSRNDDGERIKVKGITNNLKYRCMLGIEYLSQLTAHLSWPRPVRRRKHQGFGIFESGTPLKYIQRPMIWTRRPFPCTTYYLSGVPYQLETGYVLPNRVRMPHMGVLYSYHYLAQGKNKPEWRALETLKHLPSYTIPRQENP